MNIIEKLLVVQQHDCRIRELEKESRDVPKRKEEEQKRLKEHKEALDKAEAVLKGKLADIKKLELEADSRREKIAKLRTQQLEIKTNKEFKTIGGEIKVIQDGISGLEDQQLVIMEEVEKARGEVQNKQEALKEEDEAVKKDVALLDQRFGQIDAELAGIREVRAVAAKEVEPAAWLVQYERIFKRKDKGIVQIEDGVCGGCHMTLPPYVIHSAKRMDTMVMCDFCGRLLY
ncbi:MAG: C4-type zinc ribbon domain-containing protein [Kiritimatiellae bacterium]|nr:C4-type zinc ribbon domain-containing protein [Kiritimatiellia bacterium]